MHEGDRDDAPPTDVGELSDAAPRADDAGTSETDRPSAGNVEGDELAGDAPEVDPADLAGDEAASQDSIPFEVDDKAGAETPGDATHPATDATDARPKRTGLMRVLLGPGGPPKARPHPYESEPTGELERKIDDRTVTMVWLGLSTLMVAAGYILQTKYGYVTNEHAQTTWWESLTRWPLFAGLGLLGFGLLRRPWTKKLTMAGWVLFAAYWALTARDLLIREGQDYANFVFAGIGVYLFLYLAYHEWLSIGRGVDNKAVRFMNVVAFIAAGSYFLIDKITPVRIGLINLVGNHTKAGLDLFGQGDKAGLQFIVDKTDTRGPVTFWYPEKYCDPYRPDNVGEWCAENGYNQIHTIPTANNLWESMLLYTPSSESLLIVPVNIILACTAIQSIMLFVGLFLGTEAPWKQKLIASGIIGIVIYILNLIRNTGIIWFYGQGHASFWTMHNAIGKGGSLLAMLAIAVYCFKWFPPLLHSLFGVLDLKDRDGPIERTLKLGRQRPGTPPPTAAA